MRYSPRNVRIAFDHAGLTHFGGIYFFHEFLRVLQLRHFLARHLAYPRRNGRYRLSQMILALVYPIVLGSGKRLFAGCLTAKLRLTESKTFKSGVLSLTYQPVGR